VKKSTLLSPFLLAALLVALAFTSCSKVNDMHDATMRMDATTAKMEAQTEAMNANTQQMKAVTDRMNGHIDSMDGNTKDMKADTEDMNATMGQLFDSARQGAALDIRNKNWELLKSSTSLEDKGTYAGLYFDSFEFQLWTNLGQDAQKGARERLMQDAVDEFFRRVLGITHWAPDTLDPLAGEDPLKSGATDAEKADFNAVAGSLERNNRKQEENPQSAKNELSMLNLIESGLAAGQQIRAGKAKLEDFPQYVNIVLQREELAQRLLRARVQLMGFATLGYLIPITRNLEEKARYVVLGASWELDFNQMNQSQLKLVSFRLGEAIAARNFLAGLGVQEPLNSTLARVFSHGHVVNGPGSKTAHTPQNSELGQLQQLVMKQLADYTQQ
jgi:hypothetical protein